MYYVSIVCVCWMCVLPQMVAKAHLNFFYFSFFFLKKKKRAMMDKRGSFYDIYYTLDMFVTLYVNTLNVFVAFILTSNKTPYFVTHHH